MGESLCLEGKVGFAFPSAYRLYVYNMIYKSLTGKAIENDIFLQEDNELFANHVMLDAQMPEHQARVLKIIDILEIDLKKESEKCGCILFNTKKKKQFKIKDIPQNE